MCTLMIRNNSHKCSKMGSRAEKKKIRRERGKEERQQEKKKTSEKKEEIKREGGKFMVFKVSAFDYWSMTYKTLHCISFSPPASPPYPSLS
jgi:hypothetical protein